MSPSHVRFDGPILLEVPHFASIEGGAREVITLRCDSGDTWKAHSIEATDQSVRDALGSAFGRIPQKNDHLMLPVHPKLTIFFNHCRPI